MPFFDFTCFAFMFFFMQKPTFVEKKLVEFDTGFPVFNSYSFGTGYDKKSKKEYIYFGNSNTDSAKVRFFTLDGQCHTDIEDIPLKNGIKGLMNITSIFVYDIDTVVIININPFTNQMVHLNSKGECIQKINFTDSVFGFRAERYQILYLPQIESSKPFVYLACFWSWKNPQDSNLLPSSFENELEHYKVYYKMQYETPSVCKFNIRTNVCTFTEENVIPKYFSQQEDTSLVFNASTLVLNDHLRSCYAHKLFLWMQASNRILVLNPDNLQVEHSFDINSKYSSIGIPPFPLALRNQKLMENQRRDGRITRILYDKNRKMYYVVTKHAIPEEDIAFSTESPFSIHIYNTKFEKLNEQYFEEGKYDYRYIFLTSQGLFIAQNENNKNYDPTKCKFYFFEIEQ